MTHLECEQDNSRIVHTDTNTAYSVCRICDENIEFVYPGVWQIVESFPEGVVLPPGHETEPYCAQCDETGHRPCRTWGN